MAERMDKDFMKAAKLLTGHGSNTESGREAEARERDSRMMDM